MQNRDYADSSANDFARELARVNKENTVNKKVSEGLVKNLEAFGKLAEKASNFEMIMAGLGALSSGFQADWIAYFLESFGEKTENAFVSGRELPAYLKMPMKILAQLFRIKNKDGTALNSSKDFIDAQESLIGAINTTLSTASLANIAFRTIPKVLRNQNDPVEKKGILYQISTKFLPVINAVLMWATGAGKRHITHTINEIHQNGYKSQTDGAWTSGMQDYYCGSNSLALMLRQAISIVNPRIAQICEPVFGAWISGSSFLEGIRALKNEEEVADYKLTWIDNSFFGKASYGAAKILSGIFGLELPGLSKLKEGIKNPGILLTADS